MNSVIYLMRHADRDGVQHIDDPINAVGRARASQISWNCELAIVSNLCRTRQTLEASKVKFSYLLQSELCREHMNGDPCNYLPGHERENMHVESQEELEARIKLFHDLLRRLSTSFESILVVTHGTFMFHFLKLNQGIGYCDCFPYVEFEK
jgi:broad specificity phosphatase PhoE